MQIATRRLELEPCSVELLSLALGPRATSPRGVARVPPDWPDRDAVPLFAAHARALRDDPSLATWGPWIATLSGELVGDAGFKGPPGDDGGVELSYYLRPKFRGRGLAREAVAALVNWSFDQGVRVVRAECHQGNAPSIALLRALEFARVSEEDGMLWFELGAPAEARKR